jgi:hypothetical protein
VKPDRKLRGDARLRVPVLPPPTPSGAAAQPGSHEAAACGSCCALRYHFLIRCGHGSGAPALCRIGRTPSLHARHDARCPRANCRAASTAVRRLDLGIRQPACLLLTCYIRSRAFARCRWSWMDGWEVRARPPAAVDDDLHGDRPSLC